MASNATISDRLNRAFDMRSNSLSNPVLMGQDKRFQQPVSKTMLLCPCTDSSKVATLHVTSKSRNNCNEHLSSAEHSITKLNGGFDQAHQGHALTAVLC
jgi:hypothetical protein